MKKICLGKMINLLYQARARKSDQVRDICRRIFAAFNCNIDGYDKALPSHLKSGHDPVPKDLVDNARDMDEEDVNQGVKRWTRAMCLLVLLMILLTGKRYHRKFRD